MSKFSSKLIRSMKTYLENSSLGDFEPINMEKDYAKMACTFIKYVKLLSIVRIYIFFSILFHRSHDYKTF